MPQPRIYIALQFSPPVDGKREYLSIYVAAASFDEAVKTLREEQILAGPGDTYLLSDAALEHCPLVRVVNGKEHYKAPTVEEHHNWLRVMTRPQYEDGVHHAPTYIHVSH